MLSVAGGKLTTWRSTAEETVDTAVDLLPEESTRATAPCATEGTPLAGLAPVDLARRLAEAGGLPERVADGMARRLGNLAWHAPLLARAKNELRPLENSVDLCAAEVRAHLRWGAVVRLEDLVLRRVREGLWNPANAVEMLPALESIVRRELSWGKRRWAKETTDLADALEGWKVQGIRED